MAKRRGFVIFLPTLSSHCFCSQCLLKVPPTAAFKATLIRC